MCNVWLRMTVIHNSQIRNHWLRICGDRGVLGVGIQVNVADTWTGGTTATPMSPSPRRPSYPDLATGACARFEVDAAPGDQWRVGCREL